MRNTALALATVALVVMGARVLAGANEPPSAQEQLVRRVELLEGYVGYLRSREASVTTYLLANSARADALDALAAKAQAQGFTNKSMPADSRETLLAGLKALAVSLREGMPLPTEEETRALKRLESLAAAGR